MAVAQSNNLLMSQPQTATASTGDERTPRQGWDGNGAGSTQPAAPSPAPLPPKTSSQPCSSVQITARWFQGQQNQAALSPSAPLCSPSTPQERSRILHWLQHKHARCPSCTRCICWGQTRKKESKAAAGLEKHGLLHALGCFFPKDLPSLKAGAVQVATKPAAGT